VKRAFSTLLMGPGIVLIAPAPVVGGQVYLHEADAPRAIFPESTAAARKALELSDAEIASLSKALGRKVEVRSYPYLEVRGEKGTIGFIFMLDVIGQSQPIGFAVGVTPDGALQDVQVMVYREPQGDEIHEKRFRKQFMGKRLKDPIALGKDIDAISGATISSRSATYAARKGLALTELLRARAGSGGNP
jgi:Na+-translocating ferredoxin:NAD+ oxidoreductase RnfG subunit